MAKTIFDQYVGKKVILIFDDGRSISRKEGFFLSSDENFVSIDTGDKEFIPISKIVRVEFKEEEKKEGFSNV